MKQLLDGYLARFSLAPVMSEAEIAHTLLPTDAVVSSYVVQAEGTVTCSSLSHLSLPTFPLPVISEADIAHALLPTDDTASSRLKYANRTCGR